MTDPMMAQVGQMARMNAMMLQLTEVLLMLMLRNAAGGGGAAGALGGGAPGGGLSGSSPSGGGSSGGSSGASSASGDASGASSSGGDASVGPGGMPGGTETGKKLAEIAGKEATNGDSSGGWCYRDVARSLAKIGIDVSGGSAYMAADQLAKNPKVKEIKVSQGDLAKLPPGAIVVWNKGAGHEHGHISIAMGNGKEASDLMRNQITNYGTSFRVFMPV